MTEDNPHPHTQVINPTDSIWIAGRGRIFVVPTMGATTRIGDTLVVLDYHDDGLNGSWEITGIESDGGKGPYGLLVQRPADWT